MSDNSSNIVTPIAETAVADQAPQKGGPETNEGKRRRHPRRDPDLIQEIDDIGVLFHWNKGRDGEYPQGFLEIQITEDGQKFPRKEEIPVYTATDQFQPIESVEYEGSVQIRQNRKGRLYAIFMPNLRYYATLETGLSGREWLADYDVIRELRAELVFIKKTDEKRGEQLMTHHRGRVVFPHRDHVADFEAGKQIAVYLTPFRKSLGYHAIPVRHVPTGSPGQALMVLGQKSASAEGEESGETPVRQKVDGLLRLFEEEPVRKDGVLRVKRAADIAIVWRTVNPYVVLGFRGHLDADGKSAMTVADAEKYFASITEKQLKSAHRNMIRTYQLHPDLSGYSNESGLEAFAKKTGLSLLEVSSQLCLFRCLIAARENVLALVGLWSELAEEDAAEPVVLEPVVGATTVRVMGQEEIKKQGVVPNRPRKRAVKEASPIEAPTSVEANKTETVPEPAESSPEASIQAGKPPPSSALTQEEAMRLAELEALAKKGTVPGDDGKEQLALTAAAKQELNGLRRKSRAPSSSFRTAPQPKDAKAEAAPPPSGVNGSLGDQLRAKGIVP